MMRVIRSRDVWSRFGHESMTRCSSVSIVMSLARSAPDFAALVFFVFCNSLPGMVVVANASSPASAIIGLANPCSLGVSGIARAVLTRFPVVDCTGFRSALPYVESCLPVFVFRWLAVYRHSIWRHANRNGAFLGCSEVPNRVGLRLGMRLESLTRSCLVNTLDTHSTYLSTYDIEASREEYCEDLYSERD